MINFRLQRYGENPDGAILKNECFTVGTCRVPNETRLARSRYSATAQQRKKKKGLFLCISLGFHYLCTRQTTRIKEMKQITLLFLMLAMTASAQYQSQVWSPDNDNGTYTNPVINADWIRITK